MGHGPAGAWTVTFCGRRATPGLPTWLVGPCVLRVSFDLVAQDEVGAGVAGFGGGEVLAEFSDSRWWRIGLVGG